MDQSPQSERGTGPSLPTPAETQSPLVALATDHHAELASSADKKPSVPPQPMATASHARFSDEVHDYIREYIRNADQKAAFFFATLTAILAFLNTQNVSSRWLKDPRAWSFVDALGFASMLGLAAGAVVLLAVIFPRLKGSRRGFLFFNAIGEYDTSSEYANDVLARSDGDLVRTKLRHCYELSRVCGAKYRTLRVGFWIGSLGAASALLFLLLAKSAPP